LYDCSLSTQHQQWCTWHENTSTMSPMHNKPRCIFFFFFFKGTFSSKLYIINKQCSRSCCSWSDRGLGKTQRALGLRRSTVTVAAVIWDTAAQTGAKRKRSCPTTNHVDSSATDLDNGTANSLEVISPITATAVELTHTATIDKSNEVYSECTSYEVYSTCTLSDSFIDFMPHGITFAGSIAAVGPVQKAICMSLCYADVPMFGSRFLFFSRSQLHTIK
jgi:hypothetical protein